MGAKRREDPDHGVRVRRHPRPQRLAPAAASTSCGAACGHAATSSIAVFPNSTADRHRASTDASECRIPRGSCGIRRRREAGHHADRDARPVLVWCVSHRSAAVDHAPHQHAKTARIAEKSQLCGPFSQSPSASVAAMNGLTSGARPLPAPVRGRHPAPVRGGLIQLPDLLTCGAENPRVCRPIAARGPRAPS
jgi:hypothetical protein